MGSLAVVLHLGVRLSCLQAICKVLMAAESMPREHRGLDGCGLQPDWQAPTSLHLCQEQVKSQNKARYTRQW